MDGCPRLPALSFDLKLSIEPVNLCEKIPNYITSHYQENGEKYSNECEQINRLRQNAINCSMDESGIEYLKRYYCQLQLLRNRFPMLPETECAVRFTWEDGFQKEDSTYSDVRFEEACILYNIGAIYSKLGANETRKIHESMKNACTYFRCAAACFEKIRDQYTPYSVDFTPDLLTCQVHILLAQAHEAVLEKSLLDQRSPTVNAHVAMQISEYYQMALLNLMKPGISSVASKRFREWRVALTYKLSYYLSLTYYCCGLIAEENKKRGEAVCYYENAVERLKDGLKNAEKISSDKTVVYKEAHLFTNDIVMGKYKALKRDNDSVYFEKVPTLTSLSAVQGAIVAKPQLFDCHDADVSGPDIFQKLVPMDTHLAASEYSEEKAKLLREIIELTEDKNRELETFMLCLQLDRIPLNNEYLRLPRELLDCCAAVAARPNMPKALTTAMQQLNSQHHDVTEQMSDFEELLKTLKENNDSIKSNKEYQDLQNNLKCISDMMIQANESNIDLHRHMTTIMEHLKILNLPLEQLEKALPTIAELDEEINKPKLARLGLLNEKIGTMKKQRELLLNDFRKKIQDDDITKLVLMRRQENHKNLFSEQVKKHEELINIIKQNCTAQDNILQSLTEANADIADIRTNIGTRYESRKRLIQEYINSFKSFDDTLSKANEGIEFYNKQNAKLKTLNERFTALQSLQQELSSHRQPPKPHSSTVNQDVDLSKPDRPRLKDYLAAMKPDTWGSAAKVEENMYIPSPVSTRSVNSNFYGNTVPPPGPIYSNVGQNFTSLPTFNPQHYQVPSPAHHSEQTPMSFPPQPVQTSQQPSSFAAQYSVPYQSQSIDQNFGGQSQMVYNPPSVQSFPQHQQFYNSQPTYQSFPPQQSASLQQPIHHQIPQPPPQTIPTHHSGLQHPSMYQSQTFSDPHRPPQQFIPPLPAKFDPYRPQPVGAYDIPKAQQTTIPPPFIHPQDVYRPGGLLGMNQTQMTSSTMNNNNYDQNQFVQYIPPSSASVPPSSFANLSINSMSNH